MGGFYSWLALTFFFWQQQSTFQYYEHYLVRVKLYVGTSLNGSCSMRHVGIVFSNRALPLVKQDHFRQCKCHAGYEADLSDSHAPAEEGGHCCGR